MNRVHQSSVRIPFKDYYSLHGISLFAFTGDVKFGVLNTKMTDKHGTFPLYVDISGNMVKDKAYDPQVYAYKHQLK